MLVNESKNQASAANQPSDQSTTPADGIAISVKNLTKKYRIFSHPGDRIKQALTFGGMRFHNEFTALQDVSFEIKKGETVGIIGRNGSGKSTLLQLICGILKPTVGTAQVNGRIAALLELGAGFNPEFTGRENVYFQGALMGFTKVQMDERFDDIAAFADIGEFIDQPVRTYSSGMFVRLAFAAMIYADADILVIDEALAVGDEAFQKKCFDRLAAYLGGGKTLFFVSHNLRQIERVCARAVWLDAGTIAADGAVAEVCTAYQESLHRLWQNEKGYEAPLPNVADSGEIVVNTVRLLCDIDSKPTNEIESHAAARISVDFSCKTPLHALEILVGFHTTDMVFIAAATTAGRTKAVDFQPGAHRIECRFPEITLLPGTYQIRLAFFDQYRRSMWIGHRLCSFRVAPAVGTNLMHTPIGLIDLPYEWSLPTMKAKLS